ncbi:MAG: HAD-IC family P-type ATPase [Oscillospiraceae bacterium]|jgi:cation-transporting ATPase E|nr:HAD-IC family P-type ATPase [Oscillospiraceae bacterium]
MEKPLGLTSEQVRQRVAAGAVNTQPEGLTPTVGKILRKNILTLFNLINVTLAVLLIVVGKPENALFLIIAVCNTGLGILQELRSKRTLDKLAILGKHTVTVMRDGAPVQIDQSGLVLDDVSYLSSGEQICADGVVLESEGLEVNEALLTGESDNVRKSAGDTVLSGSFVTAGNACARLTAVGGKSFATALTVEAKKLKSKTSRLMRTLKAIIRTLTIIIIPVGALLFYTQYRLEQNLQDAVLSAAAGMTGMIPQGLVMLTGVTLTVSALSLARRKALVQSLSSIETLARADILCLDKTGTITDGTLSFEELIPMDGFTKEDGKAAVADLISALRDDNATARALREHFKGSRTSGATHTVPFSSARKWSGATFGSRGSLVLGAPSFVFKTGNEPFMEDVRDLSAQGLRVLCLACSERGFPQDGTLPGGLRCMALLTLSDAVRFNAPDTFRFFAEQGVTLKVISGDDPLTVSHIAEKAGIAGAEKVVDMSRVKGSDFSRIAEDAVVFGRVSPGQKRDLIKAMKLNGHTTCMTGDGVNDVLAMKESDCSVAMVNGSAAARDASDFVLMASDFSAMINVVNEGRRVINNIERIASLFLLQTSYATLLSLIFMVLPFPYPYEPLQMTPVNMLTVGIPSFFLALRVNFRRPENRFVKGIMELSVPAALTVVLNVLIIQFAGVLFDLSQPETATMHLFLIGIVGFALMYRIAQPLNKRMVLMMSLLGAAYLCVFIFGGWYFNLTGLFTRNIFFYLPLALSAHRMFAFIGKLIAKAGEWWRLHKKRG